MKSPFLIVLAAGASLVVAGLCWADGTAWAWTKPASDASPIYGVRIPAGYRDWTLVAPPRRPRRWTNCARWSATARR